MQARRDIQLQLDWSGYDSYGQGDAYAALPLQGGGFGKAAAVCIGSRQCQKAQGQPGDKGVMCPSFRVTQDDLHSTRGRAAMLREALNGNLGERPFADGTLDAAMDLCVACKGCKRECPNGVDMAALRAETLAQRWASGVRMPLRTRLFAGLPHWLPRLRAWRSVFAPALALRERLPVLARAVEAVLGIAARRSLPRLAARPFAARSAATEPTTAQHEVVLLVDCFARHIEPEVAHAALSVLQAGGYRVHLLAGAEGAAPLCCGRSAFSSGQIASARAHAQRLLQALAPHVAAGRQIVGLEPSCLSMLRDEFHQLGLDAAQVQAVSKASWMLEEFLARAIDAKHWTPPPAVPTTHALVHGHCHQKAFGTLKAMRRLLAALPGLQVEWIESSCCGMAGSFGYEAEHFEMSMRMAELALLPAVRAAPAGAVIVASGTSCRHQIRDGALARPLHLAQLLQRLLAPTGAPAA